ncbi:hypothetical protein EJB05_21095 [Eragrostis curvula]|uniref:Uncharacterized protein n=1 Tax=Eragrostis curvula TaxID=38414 RepID=A0A5J9V0U0_9POAL|nr:hypothetical protein EJB05_21095 [Eragrostis curvula]
MGCRSASSTLLVVLLAISLLALLDGHVAHARHLKSPSSMATVEHSSTKKGMHGTSKPDVANTKKSDTVEVKGSTGNAPNFGHGASPGGAKVVVQELGARPHPKKHNK